MGRRRLQRHGDLYSQGGWWKLRWRQDVIDATGNTAYQWSKPVWIGPSEGPARLTRKQADRISWDNFLSRLDQNMRSPQSVMTVAQFVEKKFWPEHVVMLKPAGRKHYKTFLQIVVDGIPEKKITIRKGLKAKGSVEVNRLFGLGSKQLRDVLHEDAQRLASEAIARNYSVQTARHIRTCVSAVFEYAERIDWFSGKNPAKFVKLPEMVRRPLGALTFDQLRALVVMLCPVHRAMVLLGSMTSMNIAEIRGLRWKRVNFSGEPIIVDGESVPAFHIAVREQFYLGWGSVKAKSRRRNVPMNTAVREALLSIPRGGPDSPVFPGEGANPINHENVMRRHVAKAAETIGIKVDGFGWHTLRRTFATLSDQIGMSHGERQALMGHSQASMTDLYTRTKTKDAMEALEKMSDKVRVN